MSPSISHIPLCSSTPLPFAGKTERDEPLVGMGTKARFRYLGHITHLNTLGSRLMVRFSKHRLKCILKGAQFRCRNHLKLDVPIKMFQSPKCPTRRSERAARVIRIGKLRQLFPQKHMLTMMPQICPSGSVPELRSTLSRKNRECICRPSRSRRRRKWRTSSAVSG